MKRFLRAIALLLTVSALLTMAACKPTPQPEADPQAIFAALVQQVDYATELEDLGDSGMLYLPGLPQGATVQMYAGSAYYVDKVALITVAREEDRQTAVACVEEHVAQLKAQYETYLPAEVPKLDKAVIWQQGTAVILCICPDAEQALAVIASNPSLEQILTDPTTEPTTEATTELATQATTVPTEPTTAPTEPVTEPTEVTTVPTEPPTEPTVPPTEPVTEPATEPTEPIPTISPEKPYPLLQSQSGEYDFHSKVYQVDNSAFEGFGYSDSAAAAYAEVLTRYAQDLAGTTNVYALTIPTAIGVVLPDDIIPQMKYFYDQGQAIDSIYSYLGEGVTPVRAYENLMRHRNEYLYFKTDHHWTALGAYYAYEAFCQVKGIAPYTPDQRKQSQFDGFKGSLYQYMQDMGDYTDTVYAYHPVCNVSMTYTNANGETRSWPVIRDVTLDASFNKYNAFAAGDNPYTEFHNPDVTDGSVCIVVKESFGCAFMPFIVDHYSTVYEIDYRYWEGSLTELAKTTGATDIIFANNAMRICTGLVAGDLDRIF